VYGIPVTTSTISGSYLSSGTVTTTQIASSTITSTNIATNGVSAANLATNAITIGYAQITSNFTTSSTSDVLVTGLTVGVTIPAGGRRVKITVFARDWYNSTAAANSFLTIYSGASSGALTTQLAQTQFNSTFNTSQAAVCYAVLMPSAGSVYYSAALRTSNAADAINLEAASTYPAFILVEAI
jgi:hypothetical protein